MITIENLIGSGSKVKLLRLFYDYPNRNFSTKEIFVNTGVGFGYGLKCLNMLYEAGLLKIKKTGRQKRYFLNKESIFYHAIERLFQIERENFPRVSHLHRGILGEIIEKLNKETVIVFGSVAAGTATLDSDIDLLILSERKEHVTDTLKTIEKKSKVKVQGIVIEKEKLRELVKKKTELMKNISREKLFLRGDEKTLELIESV